MHRRIVGAFLPMTLALDAQKITFTRPTIFGTQVRSCDRWAIGGVGISRIAGGKAPRAYVNLSLRNRQMITLFSAMPEEDANWLALLIASSLSMTVGE